MHSSNTKSGLTTYDNPQNVAVIMLVMNRKEGKPLLDGESDETGREAL